MKGLSPRIASIGAMLLGSCAADPLTEVFVCYAIEDAVAATGPTVMGRVISVDTGETLFDSQLSLGAGSVLLSQGIVQESASAVRVELVGSIPMAVGSAVELRQSAEVLFQQGRTVDVFLRLEQSCRARTCDFGETCVGGDCVPIPIGVGCLMDHDGEPTGRVCDARAATPCPAP